MDKEYRRQRHMNALDLGLKKINRNRYELPSEWHTDFEVDLTRCKRSKLAIMTEVARQLLAGARKKQIR